MVYQLVVVGLCLLGVWLVLRDGAGEEGGPPQRPPHHAPPSPRLPATKQELPVAAPRPCSDQAPGWLRLSAPQLQLL